jgi:hypothetical protein
MGQSFYLQDKSPQEFPHCLGRVLIAGRSLNELDSYTQEADSWGWGRPSRYSRGMGFQRGKKARQEKKELKQTKNQKSGLSISPEPGGLSLPQAQRQRSLTVLVTG